MPTFIDTRATRFSKRKPLQLALTALALACSACFASLSVLAEETAQAAKPAEPYYPWKMEQFAIKASIGGRKGDVTRGQKLVADRNKGNCLACHSMPIPEESFHGTIGPSLAGLASRMTEAQIRLRVVDEQQINPASIMPGYYRDPKLIHRVLWEYEGLTMLNAQEVEDVVAYLVTLK